MASPPSDLSTVAALDTTKQTAKAFGKKPTEPSFVSNALKAEGAQTASMISEMVAPLTINDRRKGRSDAGAAHTHFFPPQELDRPALPRSAPDTTYLNGIISSGLPIRLRLYVDASGTVVKVDALLHTDADESAIRRLKAMFYATSFVAGKRDGVEVASYMDIELQITDIMTLEPSAG